MDLDPPDPEEAIERALALYLALVREDPAAAGEFEASAVEFFQGPPPSGSPRETLLAARRHLEWFVLERHSPVSFGVPVERWLAEWRRRAGPELLPYDASLADSFAGVLEVTGVEPEGRLWLADLAGLGEYAVAEAPGSALFEVGDLIVGRVFPLPGGGHHVSRAAGVYRDARLRDALASDLRRVRREGGGHVRHVGQRDLEATFFAQEASEAPDPEAEARALLEEGGVPRQRVEAYLARLAASPFDPTLLAHGVGDALGVILDELAFDTEVDLDRARPVLTRTWASLAEHDPPTPDEAPAASDPRAALEAFERGRRAGGDLETLLATLERDLRLDDVEGDDDDPAPAPDFPGVVGAMVEEFLWETGRASAEDAERFGVLRALGRFAAGIGVFEDLQGQDLLRFAAFWIHEDGTLASSAEAHDLVDALERFAAWAAEAHALELGFGRLRGGLEHSLPRLVEANRHLSTVAAHVDAPGELYEVLRCDADGACELRAREGHERRARIAPEIARWLRPGDRLRARAGPGSALEPLRCYPAELAAVEVG